MPEAETTPLPAETEQMSGAQSAPTAPQAVNAAGNVPSASDQAVAGAAGALSPDTSEGAPEAPEPTPATSKSAVLERVRKVRDTVLGARSLGEEIIHTGGAAWEVAKNVSGTPLKALGKLVTLHPVQAVHAVGEGVKKTAVDLVDFAASTARTGAKGTGALAALPVHAVVGTASLAGKGAKAVGRGAIWAAKAPFVGAKNAATFIAASPFRLWDALDRGINRLFAAGQVTAPVAQAPA